MAYEEKRDKLKLGVSESDNKVILEVNCYDGTVLAVTCYTDGLHTVRCGESEEIEIAKNLKDKTIQFTCSANNPGGEPVRFDITVYEENGNSVTYSFPDDYTGTPDYDSNDDNPTIIIFVNFS